MATTIEVTDGGPIEGTFKIDLSSGPGAYEIRGARGTGKTTLLSSIDWLTGHKVDVTLHDGAVSGKVEGFGVVAPIGGRKRRKGEFCLDTIDAEKFSLTDLIDPPGKTPEVRDAHAIKALAVLSEMKSDPKPYYALAGGHEAYAALRIQETGDPVLLATRIKQAFDKAAHAKQNTAEAEAGHAASLEIVPDGLDMSQSFDLDSLGEKRDAARDTHTTLANQRASDLEKLKEITVARERLDKVKAEYDGVMAKVAEVDVINARDLWDESVGDVERIQKELEACKKIRDMRLGQYQLVEQILATAKQHEQAVTALEDTAKQSVVPPTQEEITGAVDDVTHASEAYDQGVRIRDCKQNQGRAKYHREAAAKADAEAAEAKNNAGKVFDILAKSLHTQHLEIQPVDGAPRLFVQHPSRGRTAFDHVNGLSDGERVDFTLRELLPHIESPGLLPIPQRVYQDLQPSDRKQLHELAVEKGLFLFGAQVDDGELRVVYLGDEEEDE